MIGDGAIIGAGSVVTKNVESYAIAGGNPARLIRCRCSEKLRLEIAATQWWDRQESQLSKLVQVFSNPKAFLKEAERIKRMQ